MRKIVALAFAVFVLGGVVKAQTLESKFGIDSVKTIEAASIYQEFVAQKNYVDALPAWRYVFNNAPKFQLKTYMSGEDIILNMYAKTKNPAYIDTLMMVYDQWIKYFGNNARYGEGYALGKKGASLYRLSVGNKEKEKEAFGYLVKSFELEGAKSHPLTVQMTFAAADGLLKNNEISRDEYVNLYSKFSDYADKGIATAKKKERYEDVRNTIDALFFNAGVADCQTLNTFLKAKFDKNPTDLETLKDIARLLKRGECTDLPLYSDVAEALYKANPDAQSAYNLAMKFLRMKDYEKTEAYLNEAVEKGAAEPEVRADAYLKLAQIRLIDGKLVEAKKNALEALKSNPKLGAAYIAIGRAYAAYSKKYGEDDFDHATVFWVAVDKFNKAKQVDPAVAQEANELIKAYSEYFPSKDEAFFRSVKPGDTYKVGDWINETTTARFR